MTLKIFVEVLASGVCAQRCGGGPRLPDISFDSHRRSPASGVVWFLSVTRQLLCRRSHCLTVTSVCKDRGQSCTPYKTCLLLSTLFCSPSCNYIDIHVINRCTFNNKPEGVVSVPSIIPYRNGLLWAVSSFGKPVGSWESWESPSPQKPPDLFDDLKRNLLISFIYRWLNQAQYCEFMLPDEEPSHSLFQSSQPVLLLSLQ